MPKVEKQLKRMKYDAAPRHAFKTALWSELRVEFAKTYPASGMAWRYVFAVPVAALVIFVSTGTGVYAYASPAVTRDHSLYPIKRGMESIEGLVPRTSTSAARFHARMMERRLEEGEFLQNQNKLQSVVIEDVVTQFEYTIENVEVSEQNSTTREEVSQRISTQTERYGDLLEAMSEEVDTENEERSTVEVERLRNAYRRFRVRISESALSDGEKEVLLEGLNEHRDDFQRLQFDASSSISDQMP